MPIEPTNFNHIFDVWTNDGSWMDGQKQNDRQSDRQTGRWGEGGRELSFYGGHKMGQPFNLQYRFGWILNVSDIQKGPNMWAPIYW